MRPPDADVRTITHKHANMYLIAGKGGCFLFDCGWADSFRAIRSALREWDVPLDAVTGVFVSHFHPDHAGCVETLRRHGVRPMILERQIPFIPWLNAFFKQKKNDPTGSYLPLDPRDVEPCSPQEARSALLGRGIDGHILYTPGHSEDGISLVTGDMAFVGDLPPRDAAFDNPQAAHSWRELQSLGAKRIFHAHAPHGVATE